MVIYRRTKSNLAKYNKADKYTYIYKENTCKIKGKC